MGRRRFVAKLKSFFVMRLSSLSLFSMVVLRLFFWTVFLTPSISATAFRRDRPAHRRPGRHGGTEHTAPGRGAEGGATGRPHCGRLRLGEQDGEGLSGHPPRHRLHRLPVHPLTSGGGGANEAGACSQAFLCVKGVRIHGGGKDPYTGYTSDVPAEHIYVYMKMSRQ